MRHLARDVGAGDQGARPEAGRPSFRLPAIVLLSLLAMEMAILASRYLGGWEAASADLRMRVRYLVSPREGAFAAPDITVIAIGPDTERAFGRYGAGPWVSRQPFFDLLSFLQGNFRPSVLAFDLVFRDSAGEEGARGAGSGGDLAEGLKRVLTGEEGEIPPDAMDELGRRLSKQGDVRLAHRFAATVEDRAFPCVVGYYFRGGFLRAQHEDVRVPPWSDRDVFGDSPQGDEERGERIPYLKDVAIPPGDVRFASPEAASAYVFMPNAVLPAREVLDYVLLGFLDGAPDDDSVVRRVPLVLGTEYVNSVTGRRSRVFVPSFALAACLLHLGMEFPLRPGQVEVRLGREVILRPPGRGEYRIPVDAQGRMYLDFSARLGDFRGLEFRELAPSSARTTAAEGAKAARARKQDGSLDGRLAVVAVNSAGVDVGACPIDARTPLALVHLTAMQNILERRFVAPLGSAGKAGLLVLVFLAFTCVCHVERAVRLGPAAVGCVVLYAVAAYAALHLGGVLVPMVGPLFYMVMGSFFVLSYRYFTEERARKRIRSMFSTMVSDKVLVYLEQNPESFSLRGHNVEATVFFSDIADFTRISESLPPEKLTRLLNAYLTPVTDCILRRGGYVDKYVGDTVMAVWGAPNADPDHAVNACLAALEQQEIVAGLNARIAADYGVELSVRMGLNSGMVTAGMMGSEKKSQYTVVGDVVNLASRLEPTNKDFGTRIIVGEATRRAAGDRVVARPLGRIVVVGKQEPATIYELVGRAGAVAGRDLDRIRRYEEALDRFFRREWNECARVAEELLAAGPDGPAQHLRLRALFCRDHPPPADWQGEYVRTEKY